MTALDLDALQAVAEAAIINGDPEDWPLEGAVGWDRPEDNRYVAALSPGRVLALIAELRQERERADEAENADTAHQEQWITSYYGALGERDDAQADLARAREVIEKVRGLHFEHENTSHTIPKSVCAHRYCVDGMGDQVAWPCPTGRILTEFDKQKGADDDE